MKNIETFLESLREFDLNRSYKILEELKYDPREQVIVARLKEFLTAHWLKQRSRKQGALLMLRNAGFQPELVVDVGAQVGTPELFTVYPSAKHVFVEPVEECIPKLRAIAHQLASAEVICAAISNYNGRTALSVSESLQYSSILGGQGDIRREVDTLTLDSICNRHPSARSLLIKIDVDGAEFHVLQGARDTLARNTVFIIEASIAEEHPRFQGLVEFMGREGYRIYDIVDPLYRPSDSHLWQVDLVFARPTSQVFSNWRYK